MAHRATRSRRRHARGVGLSFARTAGDFGASAQRDDGSARRDADVGAMADWRRPPAECGEAMTLLLSDAALDDRRRIAAGPFRPLADSLTNDLQALLTHEI